MESSDKHIVQVEVHLKKGLPKTLSILIDKWNHTYQLDYRKLSLQCKTWHEYGYFVRDCKQSTTHNNTKEKELNWKQVKQGLELVGNVGPSTFKESTYKNSSNKFIVLWHARPNPPLKDQMRPISEVEALPQPWYILVSSQPIIEETSPLMESLETHGLVPDVEVIYS